MNGPRIVWQDRTASPIGGCTHRNWTPVLPLVIGFVTFQQIKRSQPFSRVQHEKRYKGGSGKARQVILFLI
jgi:hypothetical protein